MIDTEDMFRRIEQKHLGESSPFGLSQWIVSSLIRRELDLVASLAKFGSRPALGPIRSLTNAVAGSSTMEDPRKAP
jgi:hypothetical protein